VKKSSGSDVTRASGFLLGSLTEFFFELPKKLRQVDHNSFFNRKKMSENEKRTEGF